MFLPLAAFFSEAVGSRTRGGPSMGALVAMTFIAAVGMLSYPEFSHYQRHADWAQFANAATPAPVAPPSLYRLVVGGPTRPMTLGIGISVGGLSLVLAVATVSLSVLAYQVRKRRSIGAWLVGLSPFVSVFVVTWGVMWFLARVFGPLPRDVYALYPPVSQLVTLFSLTVLPLVLAGYLAQQTTRRGANSGSAVTA